MSDISENNLEELSQKKNGDMQSEQELKNLKNQLEQEQEKVLLQEKKIQYLLADFENIKKRSEIDVQNRVNSITDGMILKFLGIYDDFVRARDALSKQHVDSQG